MRVVVIGDIHGRTTWKEIVEKELENSDKIVFLGDYHDPYNYEFEENLSSENIKNLSIENLKEIIQLKKDNLNKVILLIGNHDVHYLYPQVGKGCSRYDYSNEDLLIDLFNANKELFQLTYQYKNHLFVHAGITNYWLKNRKDILRLGIYPNYSNLSESLNEFVDSVPSAVLQINDVGYCRGGWSRTGGPIWLDISETSDLFNEVETHQIVGHSQVKNITSFKEGESSITFCDVLGNKELSLEEKYLTLEI